MSRKYMKCYFFEFVYRERIADNVDCNEIMNAEVF